MRLLKDYGYSISQIKKINKGLCVEAFCRTSRVKHRHRCSNCEKRKYANENPEKYCFQVLRQNARYRRKFFDLTFEQFLGFLVKTNYLELRGRCACNLSIDRRINEIGYTISNIRAITVRDNSLKRHFVDYKIKGKKYNHEEAKRLAGTPF